ncbi:MAG: hypothetical protein FWD90_12895 [Defluviitaleaceae bacterium]|nr:hypothetical protein [Defluviitaleaceae bacterium]
MDTIATFARNFRDIGLTGTFIFAGLSLIAVTAERYFKSVKYNIPFKLSQVNIHDFADGWIELFVLFGIGIILPFIAAAYPANFIISSFLVFIMVMVATLANKIVERWLYKRKIWKAVLVLLISIIVTVSFVYVGHSSSQVNYETGYYLEHQAFDELESLSATPTKIGSVTFLIVAIYVTAILFAALYIICARIAGDDDFIIASDENDEKYIVVLRYKGEKWILVPCEIGETKDEVRKIIFGIIRRLYTRTIIRYKQESQIKTLDNMSIIKLPYQNVRLVNDSCVETVNEKPNKNH